MISSLPDRFRKTGENIKRSAALALCAAVAIGSLTGCAVKSSRAQNGTKSSEPRVISTSVSICEIMDRLDLDLVGVPDSSFQLPARYDGVQRVGLPMSPDLEIVKSLNPTVIVSPNSLQYDLKPEYESIGVASIFMNLMSVEGMLKSIGQLGELYDRKDEAGQILAEHETFMEEYNKKTEGKEKPKVLVLMGLPGAYMVATENSYVGNLVRLAGGENVFAPDGGNAFLNLNTEAIAQTDPDVILRAAHGLPEEVKKSFAKEFAENDIWKHFRAVQDGKVFDLDYNIFNMSASLTYREALTELKTMLYGD